jgi:hypothetical protein
VLLYSIANRGAPGAASYSPHGDHYQARARAPCRLDAHTRYDPLRERRRGCRVDEWLPLDGRVSKRKQRTAGCDVRRLTLRAVPLAPLQLAHAVSRCRAVGTGFRCQHRHADPLLHPVRTPPPVRRPRRCRCRYRRRRRRRCRRWRCCRCRRRSRRCRRRRAPSAGAAMLLPSPLSPLPLWRRTTSQLTLRRRQGTESGHRV